MFQKKWLTSLVQFLKSFVNTFGKDIFFSKQQTPQYIVSNYPYRGGKKDFDPATVFATDIDGNESGGEWIFFYEKVTMDTWD